MTRLRHKEATIKQLFALSGNQCAMPKCTETLIEDEIVVGEVCHIEAANPKGQRYRNKQTDEERRAFENLVLFCPKHHKLSDDEKKYPVEKLKNIKKEHEKKFKTNPYKIPENQFKKIYTQVLSKIEELEKKIELISSKLDVLPEIKSETNTIKNQNDEILDLLINEKIENTFDLKKYSADVVVSRFSQALKKIKQTSDGYNINMNVSNDKTSIEIVDKNFDKMEKKGMIFQTTLKLSKQKSESLHTLLKNSKNGKIKFDASEMEQITITKDGKPVYIVNGLGNAELSIKNNTPKPRMVKILIPNESVEYRNLSLQGEKKNDLLILSNKDQMDYPILVEFEIDRKKKQGKFRFSNIGKSEDLEDAYEYRKFLNKLYKQKILHVLDQESDKIILVMDVKIDQKEEPKNYEEFLGKLLLIQKKMKIVFPWPQDISKAQIDVIIAVYDIITTGKTSISLKSTLVSEKQDVGIKAFMKSLKKRVIQWENSQLQNITFFIFLGMKSIWAHLVLVEKSQRMNLLVK